MKKLRVVVVGLRFGASFVPIWRDHPDVAAVGIVDLDREQAEQTAKAYGIEKVYASLEDVLRDGSVDAVHLVTCIPDHARQSIQILEAGKHCACTVPMATNLDDIRQLTEAVRRSGKNYMMMETTLYTYHYFYVKRMIESGELGRIQFLRGSHYQDMEAWPDYWMGLPPFWYGTHAIAPMIGLSGSRVDRVSCLGSGAIREELAQRYGSPFAVESVHLHFENGLAGEATRSLFETARKYQEGLNVYGSRKSFEWGFSDGDDPWVTVLGDCMEFRRGKRVESECVEMPNSYADLPKALWPYTVGKNYDATNPQLSLQKGAGGGHHGSHPHLVNEFARSIIEERKPWIDEQFAANITACGICAHESAMQGGAWLEVPRF